MIKRRPANKQRKSSALRTSFGPSQFDQDDEESSNLVVPKRSNLSRIAIQRNAEKRPAPDLVFRAPTNLDHDRPSYNKDYLEELRHSTPSTPKDQSFRNTSEPSQTASREIDIASKFGANLSSYQPPTAIPTDAEIKEKKERRARLAKEQEFISLDDDQDYDNDEEDDDNVTRDAQGRLILKPKEEYVETRLVPDDEDMYEGFEDFTTDNRINFSRKAEKEAATKRKAEMASLIADAEGPNNDEDEADESEAERNAAFEIAQTRHGNYAAKDDQDEELARPQTPPKILPLPTIDAVVERLRKKLEEMEILRMNKMKEMQRLVDEKSSIGEEEVRVQAALKETGERYSRMRGELRPQTDDSEAPNASANGNEPSISDQDIDLGGRSEADDQDADGALRIPRAGLGA